MHDFLILGGGVVGLSLSWELARRGKQVCLVDRREMGKASSWAGAGIFPPPHPDCTHEPLEQLRGLSHRLHKEWSTRLKAETGIDNQLTRCGGLYLAREPAEAAALRLAMQEAIEEGVTVEELDSDSIVRLEPALSPVVSSLLAAFRLPQEMQIRTPRHLRALLQACAQDGVVLRPNTDIHELRVDQGHIHSVVTPAGSLQAKQYCITSGAWSSQLLTPLGIDLPIEPWRGQLILWKPEGNLLSHVVNEGYRYLVPRRDGQVIAGATVEDVGFDDSTTQQATEQLASFSRELLPALSTAAVVKTWAGLRPGTPDGRPYLDRVAGIDNLFVAAGHYRSGLHVSTGTAVVMADRMLDDEPSIDLSPFRINR